MADSKSKDLNYFFGRGNTLWGFAEGLQTGESVSIVRVIWGRIFLLVLTLALAGWLSLGTALFYFLKYGREYSTITYGQTIFPWRWPERRVTQGNELIERAKTQLGEQRLRDAFYSLRVGVNLSPQNHEGRLLLAQFFTVMGRQDQAIDLMVSGLVGAENNQEYLRSLFQLLLQFQEDQRVREIAERLLPATPEVNPRNQLIALAYATALFHRGNYDQAEDTVMAYDLLRTREGWPLMARIDWERGARTLAIQRLEQLADRSPSEDNIYIMLGSFYREMGMDTKAESIALLRQLMNPDSPAPRIGLMYAFREKGDSERLNHAIENFFRDFGSNREALWALADYAANTGNPELAERVVESCNVHNLPKDGPTLMMVEATIVSKQYRRGLDMIERLTRDNPRWASQFGAVINGLQAIANFGINNRDVGDAYLTQFLNRPNVRTESLLAVSNRLLEMGSLDRARRVLEQAVRADPLNQAALSRLISIDLDLGFTADMERNINQLTRMRKPSISLMERAVATLNSDQFVFLADRERILEQLRSAIDSRRATLGANAT
jgi:tetratricopeptide (TPR) repeat protein